MSTSGVLLRQAGLSQSELARRAGAVQSVISDDERGERQPALATLERLVAATGHQLLLGLQPSPARPRVARQPPRPPPP